MTEHDFDTMAKRYALLLSRYVAAQDEAGLIALGELGRNAMELGLPTEGIGTIAKRYALLLSRYVEAQDEASLIALGELGRNAMELGLPTEGIGSIHQAALLGLAREYPDLSFEDAIKTTPVPLVEFLMAYGLAFREQVARRAALLQDLEEHELYKQMFMSNQAVQLLIDPEFGSIVDANPAACAFYGYSVEEFKDIELSSIVVDNPERQQEYLPGAEDGMSSELGLLHKLRSGVVRDIEVYPSDVTVQGRRLIYWIVHDITERKKAEDTVRNMAQTDFLTGLPNRSQFHRRLEEAAQTALRINRMVALLFLDLDGFKAVNDTYGHPVGDKLLKDIAGKLEKLVRQTDMVARLGGDEFAIILTNLEDSTGIGPFAARTIKLLSQPVNLSNCVVKIGTSIGISFYPSDATEPTELIKKADLSLYQAKLNGRGTYCFYDENLHRAMQGRGALESDMQQALARGEFVLYYQPQVKLPGNRITGVEALIRWTHPVRGLVSPGDFIPIAESSNLIIEIGEWVLHESCRQLKAWRDDGLPSLRMAVNVSALQFQSESLMQTVISALDNSGLPPNQLELEITEGAMVTDIGLVMKRFRALNDLGVQLAVDDFGTGYSSLSYLKKFPIQRLKIDQSFIENIVLNIDDAAIVRAIIDLGRSLNLEVIAEGVETSEQAAYLFGKGCIEAQGYLFSRPLPAKELETWIRDTQYRGTINEDVVRAQP